MIVLKLSSRLKTKNKVMLWALFFTVLLFYGMSMVRVIENTKAKNEVEKSHALDAKKQ